MRAVIVGCGRVGATMARALDTAGHDVTIIDLSTRAFDRLPATFRGSALRGDGTDEDTLRRAATEGADLFLALTEGDNRNVMAAQLAQEALAVGRVYAKVNDPVRAKAYAELGIGTLCRTTMMADALLAAIGQPGGGEPSIREGVAHAHPGAALAGTGRDDLEA
ncbi:MAG: NAD-binding protein [Chloroflexi bacterium]|nr:NAD-binding protein [Chloroflexota bacterium]